MLAPAPLPEAGEPPGLEPGLLLQRQQINKKIRIGSKIYYTLPRLTLPSTKHDEIKNSKNSGSYNATPMPRGKKSAVPFFLPELFRHRYALKVFLVKGFFGYHPDSLEQIIKLSQVMSGVAQNLMQ